MVETLDVRGETGAFLFQLVEYRGEISHQWILAGANSWSGLVDPLHEGAARPQDRDNQNDDEEPTG